MLHEHDVELISTSESLDTGTADGRVMVNILTFLVQWKWETASQRTRQTVARLRLENRAAGPPPYGYTTGPDGFLIKNSQEQEILALIHSLRQSDVSYSKIAAKLNERGYTNRADSPFSRQGVHNIIKRAQRREATLRRKAADHSQDDIPGPDKPNSVTC